MNFNKGLADPLILGGRDTAVTEGGRLLAVLKRGEGFIRDRENVFRADLRAARRGSTAWSGVFGHCWDVHCAKNSRSVSVYSNCKGAGAYLLVRPSNVERYFRARFENIAKKGLLIEEGSEHASGGWKRG